MSNRQRTTRGDRAAVTLLMAASLFIGAVFYFASPARADDGTLTDAEAAYVANYGPAVVCDTLTEVPSISGVIGLETYLTNGAHFTPQAAEDITDTSVVLFCPQHRPLLRAYAKYRAGLVVRA